LKKIAVYEWARVDNDFASNGITGFFLFDTNAAILYTLLNKKGILFLVREMDLRSFSVLISHCKQQERAPKNEVENFKRSKVKPGHSNNNAYMQPRDRGKF
jgi:hypothetical protein